MNETTEQVKVGFVLVVRVPQRKKELVVIPPQPFTYRILKQWFSHGGWRLNLLCERTEEKILGVNNG